jgi:CelD/BcsL family acetyltransferase involved in cellulose biosynthesis
LPPQSFTDTGETGEFSLRIVLHRNIPDDLSLREQWNTLVMQMEPPEVFYTHQWAVAVQRAYRDFLEPWLLLQYEGEVLTGVAALATEQGRATFLAGNTADYCDFLSHPSGRARFLDTVFAELRNAGVEDVVLTNLPADSATIKSLRPVADRHKYHIFLRTAYLCAQVQLGSGKTREELKAATNKRKMFRRSMNLLVKQGRVSLAHRATWGAIEPTLHEYSVAHVARFLATGRVSNLVSTHRRVFLGELARLLSGSGWLVLSELVVENQRIAWNYGFQFHGSWSWYQPTFDTAFEQVSPGYCLLTKMISEACDAPEMNVVDLGLGAEGYKERFANTTRRTLHGTITTSRGHQVREMLRYRAAQAVKSSPRLEAGIRAGIQRWGFARRRFRQGGPRGFVAWAAQRLSGLLSRRDEVLFWQWSPDSPPERENVAGRALRLEPLTLEILARAAMQFEGDSQTYAYLLRAANRLRSDRAKGFALLDEKGTPVHFCWVAAFEGFYMDELNISLSAPAPNASLIFDCWTPAEARARGYYGVAVTLTARQVLREGQSPWIFTAASNQASIRGLAKTRFERRYSMIRRKTLMVQRLERVASPTHPAMEVPVRS